MGPCSKRRHADDRRPRTPLEEYCATVQRPSQVQSVQNTLLFPMYVVRTVDFLGMTEARPHQVLKLEGIALEYRAQLGEGVFVSHQWCGSNHPDPHFAQLSVLQRFLRRLFAQRVSLQTDLYSFVVSKQKVTVKVTDLLVFERGFIWYDYFSVPQPSAPVARSSQHTDLRADLGKAVNSIPAYVELCRFFIILAPPVTHADFKEQTVDYPSWKQRGWCRLERVARILSPRETTVLLLTRDDLVYQVGAHDSMVNSVGDGNFSVEADRVKLAPIVLALVENKLQSLLRQKDLYRYRRMLGCRAAVLHGLVGVSPLDCCAPGFRVDREAGDEVDSFLRLHGFSSAVDKAGGFTEPILFAAAEGDLVVVRGLVERRANILAVEEREDPDFVIAKGMGVLHHVSQFARQPSLVVALLKLRADLQAVDAKLSAAPLRYAAVGGSAEMVGALLDARAEADVVSRFGTNALCIAAICGQVAAASRLLAAGADPSPNADGLSPLLLASMFNGGADMVKLLLAVPGVDTQACCNPRWCSLMHSLAVGLSLPRRLAGSRRPFPMLGYYMAGATPLHMAAMLGCFGEARALVEGGADTLVRNRRGKTPADLAEIAGLCPASVAYFRGRDPDEAQKHPAPGSRSSAERFVEIIADDFVRMLV